MRGIRVWIAASASISTSRICSIRGLSFGADGQQWWTYTPAYNSVVTGGKATVTHRTSPQVSWSVSLTSERNSSADLGAKRSTIRRFATS